MNLLVKFDLDPSSGSLRIVFGAGGFADQSFQRQFANLGQKLVDILCKEAEYRISAGGLLSRAASFALRSSKSDKEGQVRMALR